MSVECGTKVDPVFGPMSDSELVDLVPELEVAEIVKNVDAASTPSGSLEVVELEGPDCDISDTFVK